MNGKTKLELTWIGKEDQPRLEPRILIEQPEHSVPATDGTPDNMLIHGDNLLALKALAHQFGRQFRLIYLDPPYNTGAAFDHYDDGLEHSIWLSLIRDRLSLVWTLLRDDGSIWINIDDNEGHYLKVLCDELFGRRHFVANIVWQKRTSRENRATIGSSHDHILVYSKCPAVEWKTYRNKLPPSDAGFSNPDNDARGPWRSIPFTAQGYRPNQMYDIVTPTGNIVKPPTGRCWGATEPVFKKYVADARVYFPRGGDSRPRIKQFMGEEGGLVPSTWWEAKDCGDNEEAKKEILALFPNTEPFGTPKPERLLQRIIQIASNPGDLVLDSFAGSGTTGAVAQKLGRRWVMVEVGDHAVSHVLPRLTKVTRGEDAGGVTESAGWGGGSGFRFYRLAPSMLERDRWGNWVVSKDYNAAMLAEAMCRHMGFAYAPSRDPAEYWKHGYSTERDFIYVTTQALTHTMLAALSHEVGPNRHLLICCKAFSGKADGFDNLTIRKIPQAVLATCEWGRDDYSFQITATPPAPAAEPPEGEAGPEARARRSPRRSRTSEAGAPGLFDVTSDPLEG